LSTCCVAWTWPWEYPDLPTVEYVELENFVGHWYEIARLPWKTEMGCTCDQQLYTLMENSTLILANNSCHQGSHEAPTSFHLSTLWSVDDSNAKFIMQHTWLLSQDFQVIALDTNYRWAMIGDPEKEHLWIVSRKPDLNSYIYRNLVAKAKGLGFPVQDLVQVDQNCGDNYE